MKRITLLLTLLTCFSVCADEVYRARIYFGLSKPDGGAVSVQEWEEFRQIELSQLNVSF